MSKPDSSGTTGEEAVNQVVREDGKHLLRTKFHIPSVRSSQVQRPRLFDLLDRGTGKRLILVSAPAGYGKTTLVSTWLQETGMPCAWLSLDIEDNSPVRFMKYLLGAIQTSVPGFGDDLRNILEGAQPGTPGNLVDLLTDTLGSLPDQFVLVLDDFHLINNEAVINTVAHLLEHLPDHKLIVLITRIDPPLPLARLRVRDQMADVRSEQLRFTRDEVAAFLNDVMGLRLSAGDLSAMSARTEGWVAGLQLAGLSMQGSTDVHGFVTAFSGSHHHVIDYLAEEVLKVQSGKVGAFLLRTSILDQMCGALCESVVGADGEEPLDGQAMLENLEKRNLFVIPLDDERHWYRYHHLFADVLRKRLGQQYPRLLPELHRRAAGWFEQNGLVPEAIRHSLAGEDHDRAIRLIEQNGPLLLMGGELNALSDWVNAVESRSQTHPWIYIIKAWLFILTGQPERAEEGLQTAEVLISRLEADTQVKTMLGAIATGRSYRSFIIGDIGQTATFARQAVEYLPDVDLVSRSIRSIATALLGEASLMNGELEEARRACTEAKQIGRAAGDVHAVIIVNCALGRIFTEQGLLHQAAEVYAETLQIATRPDGREMATAGEVYAQFSQVSYEWNGVGTAMEQVRRCLALCRQGGQEPFQAAGSIMLARLERISGNTDTAIENMSIAESLTKEHHFALKYTLWVKYALVCLWIALGNLERASHIVQESGVTPADEIPYLREPEFLALLRVLLAQGDFDVAMALSKRLLQKAEAGKRTGRVIEILVLEALIRQGRKEMDQALAVLKRALSLGKPERYIRTFADEGEPMARLLHLARSRQIETGYVTELLSAIEGDAGAAKPPPRPLAEPLTKREAEVLRLIEAGSSNQEIAEKLVISIATVKRHISNIYNKLDAGSRTQAIAIGKEMKLLQ